MGRNEGSVNCISDFEGRLKESLIDTKIAQMKKRIFLKPPITVEWLSQTRDDPWSLNTGAAIPFLSTVVCFIMFCDF